jgi:hypothetical protein
LLDFSNSTNKELLHFVQEHCSWTIIGITVPI